MHFSMTVHGTSSAGPADFDILSATLSSILFLKRPLVCVSQPLSLLNLSRIQIHNSLFKLLKLLIHAWNLEELRRNLNPEPLSELQVVFELLDPPFLLLKLPLKPSSRALSSATSSRLTAFYLMSCLKYSVSSLEVADISDVATSLISSVGLSFAFSGKFKLEK